MAKGHLVFGEIRQTFKDDLQSLLRSPARVMFTNSEEKMRGCCAKASARELPSLTCSRTWVTIFEGWFAPVQ